MPHRRAGGDDVARRNQHAPFVKPNFRIALAKQRPQPPGRRRVVTAQKTRLGQQKCPDACRADPRASACQARSWSAASFDSCPSSTSSNGSGILVPSAGTITQSGCLTAPVGCTGTLSPSEVCTASLTPATTHSNLGTGKDSRVASSVGGGKRVEHGCQTGVEYIVEGNDNDLHGAYDTENVICGNAVNRTPHLLWPSSDVRRPPKEFNSMIQYALCAPP